MIITDYYKFQHLPDCKSKTRMDCTASTKSYNEFETLRSKRGELFIYFGDTPENFHAHAKRKSDKAITKTKNISSVFIPDVNLPFAYGDVKGTPDAILIEKDVDNTTLEIFVARGQKNNRINIWQMISGGELDDEMSGLKKRAVTESVTDKKIEE